VKRTGFPERWVRYFSTPLERVERSLGCQHHSNSPEGSGAGSTAPRRSSQSASAQSWWTAFRRTGTRSGSPARRSRPAIPAESPSGGCRRRRPSSAPRRSRRTPDPGLCRCAGRPSSGCTPAGSRRAECRGRLLQSTNSRRESLHLLAELDPDRGVRPSECAPVARRWAPVSSGLGRT
jgi:hypothetical protein